MNPTPTASRSFPAPLITVGALALTLLLLCLRAREQTFGRLTYALDDAYIHLALARNLADNGTFGVNAGEFAAASSSPLWTCLLAATIRVAGARDWIAGVWALLFAAGSLLLVDRFCRDRGLGAVFRVIVGLAVLYFTPLAVLVTSGMEHTAHLFFVLLATGQAARLLDEGPRRSPSGACWAVFLATGMRYESLFLAAPLSAILFLRGRRAAGIAFAASALLPVVLFGLYSLAQGGFFLPNSLLLKANFPHFDSLRSIADALGYRGFGVLINLPQLLNPVLLLLLGACLAPSPRGGVFWCCIVLPIASLLHAQFASFGWFYRYEAWLVGLSIPVIAAALAPAAAALAREPRGTEFLGRMAAAAAVLVLLLWPLHRRAREAHRDTPLACRHIELQHRQLAAFLRSSLPAGTTVAVNDIGAVAFEGGCRVLDLWGLGSGAVTRIRRTRGLTAEDIDSLLKTSGAQFAAIYDVWYPNRPGSMIPVAEWRLRDAYYTPAPVVFYAVGPGAVPTLEKALRTFPPPPSTVLKFLQPTPGGEKGS